MGLIAALVYNLPSLIFFVFACVKRESRKTSRVLLIIGIVLGVIPMFGACSEHIRSGAPINAANLIVFVIALVVTLIISNRNTAESQSSTEETISKAKSFVPQENNSANRVKAVQQNEKEKIHQKPTSAPGKPANNVDKPQKTIIKQENTSKTNVDIIVSKPKHALRVMETRNNNFEVLKNMDVEILYKDTNIYTQDDLEFCISGVTIYREVHSDKLYASFDITASSEDSINALLLSIDCFTVWGDKLEGVNHYQVLDLNTKRYETLFVACLIPLPENETRRVKIRIEKIAYYSGRVIENSSELDKKDGLPEEYLNKLSISKESENKKNRTVEEIKVKETNQTVSFGNYCQDKTLTKTELEWIVLDRHDNKTLLLSKYAIASNKIKYDGTFHWEESSVSKWLNEEFINEAFSIDEQKMIIANSEIHNDKVFLLSQEEAERYLVSAESRKCHPTERVAGNGSTYSYIVWWLRTRGSNPFYIVYVDTEGDIDQRGRPGQFNYYGVRPAIWVDLSKQ